MPSRAAVAPRCEARQNLPPKTTISGAKSMKLQSKSNLYMGVPGERWAYPIHWMLSHKPNTRSHRGVAFLDPFGAHLKWDSIQDLATTKVFEVIINFPLHMCLNRLMTINPDIRKSWRDQLDGFFPTGWYDEVYETVGGLLGDQKQKRSDALERVLKWYCRTLEFTFGFVSEPRLIRNTRGGPLYYLIWAGPNQAGLKGADYIMRMGERF